MVKRSVVAALIALGSMGSAVAHADDDPLSVAMSRAALFWGTSPCDGHVSISAADLSSAGLAAEAGNCTLVINGARFPDPSTEARDWPRFCQVITHENGHLVLGPNYFAGINPNDPAHSPNPADVMFSRTTAIPTTCLPVHLRIGDLRYDVWRSSVFTYESTVYSHSRRRRIAMEVDRVPFQAPWWAPGRPAPF